MNNHVNPEWTQQEEQRLAKLCGTKSYRAMSEEDFPTRSVPALQKKALKLAIRTAFRPKTHSHNIDFWKNPNLINAYWAGFAAADSNLAKARHAFTIQIQKPDKHHLQLFRDTVKFTGEIRYYKEYPTLSIAGCQEWYKDLDKIWSITPNKMYSLQPPKITDCRLINAFLIGLIDGDGWISLKPWPKRGRLGIVNASLNFLTWVKDCIEILVPPHERIGSHPPQPLCINNAKDGNYYILHIEDLRMIKLVDILKDIPVPKLNRKWFKPELLAQIESDREKYPHLFVPK